MNKGSGNAAILIILLVAGTFILMARESIRGKSSFFSLPKGGFINTGLPPITTGNKIETASPSGAANSSASNDSSNSSQPPKPAPIPPRGFTVDQLSPFFKQIRVGSVSQTTFYIYANSPLENPTTVTGWQLKGNRAGITIPGGIENYNPIAYTEGEIILSAGHHLYAYGNLSGFGKNIRLNKCMGYLNNVYSFNPRLPEGCPIDIDRYDTISFSGKCQSYIASLGSCREPSSEEMAKFANEDACISYIKENFGGYGKCYENHRRDKDFLSNTWYAWLGKPMPFDPLHDRILLLDRNNLLVDEYVY